MRRCQVQGTVGSRFSTAWTSRLRRTAPSPNRISQAAVPAPTRCSHRFAAARSAPVSTVGERPRSRSASAAHSAGASFSSHRTRSIVASVQALLLGFTLPRQRSAREVGPLAGGDEMVESLLERHEALLDRAAWIGGKLLEHVLLEELYLDFLFFEFVLLRLFLVLYLFRFLFVLELLWLFFHLVFLGFLFEILDSLLDKFLDNLLLDRLVFGLQLWRLGHQCLHSNVV